MAASSVKSRIDDTCPKVRSTFLPARDSSRRLADSILEDAAASAALARRHAMMLVDVLAERHEEVLKYRWIFIAAFAAFCYLRYALPIFAYWGVRQLEAAGNVEAFAGGAYSRVNLGVLVLVTLAYVLFLHCAARIMEPRGPLKSRIFEIFLVYNSTQMLLNLYVFVHLIHEVWAGGSKRVWGNLFDYTNGGYRLGYFIWLHYHCCQLELLDTVFVVMRKKFQKITLLHVWLRLLNMWAWFFACRYACGGDTYFAAATNAFTRAVVYAFYTWSLLSSRAALLLRRKFVTRVQMVQFGVCIVHASFCLYNFWDMQIPRSLLVLYFFVMLTGLGLYTDFQFQAVGKSVAHPESKRKVSFAFDSSGWLYCYHFGVAAWLRQHMLPDGLTPEDSITDKFPSDLIFSGSSGGALAAAVVALGLDPSEVFEEVLKKQPECRFNPFRMLPAVEDVVHNMLPNNAWQSLTGRVRVILTRLSFKYPFFTAEVVNQFSTNEDVFHALRASCHVPLIAGFGPYCYDGNFYLDGLFWPQMLVPWKGTRDDFMVRVSALTMPSSDIRPPIVPLWWAIFPPSLTVLRGLFWMGYRDAGRWFAQEPSKAFDLLSCRKCGQDSEVSEATAACSRSRRKPSNFEKKDVPPKNGSRVPALERATSEAEEFHSSTWVAARELLLRTPTPRILPDADAATGKKPDELIEACMTALQQDRWRIMIPCASFCVLAAAWLLKGWF